MTDDTDTLEEALGHVEELEQELAHVAANAEEDSIVGDEAARALTGLVAARHALTSYYADSEESS